LCRLSRGGEWCRLAAAAALACTGPVGGIESGWNRAGERSGVAAGPTLVRAADQGPLLVATLG